MPRKLLPLIVVFALTAYGQDRPRTPDRMVTIPSGAALLPKGSIEGTVSSETTGAAVTGARVTLSRRFGNILELLAEDGSQTTLSARTDGDGRFAFSAIVPADYDLTIEMDSYITRRLSSRDTTRLVVAAGQRVRGMDVRITPASRIRGFVRTPEGQPVEGIAIDLLDAALTGSPVRSRTQTAADGSYTMENLAEGDYFAIGGSQGSGSFVSRVRLGKAEALTREITLNRDNTYTVRGTVRQREMAVRPQSARIRVQVTQAGLREPVSIENAIIRYNAADGSFEIPGLRPAIYSLDVPGEPPEVPGSCSSTTAVVADSDVKDVLLVLSHCR